MYKQIKPLQPSGKINTNYGEEMPVQEALFKMGYGWDKSDGGTHQDFLKVGFIGWDINKKIYWCMSEKTFHEQGEPLHIFTDYFTTEPLK